MLFKSFSKTGKNVSAVGLGTWVMGGWPWNEIRLSDAESAIETALELGVNLIDTAPIYGCGRSEEIVGKTLKRLKRRENVFLATKCGLSWEMQKKRPTVWKDSSPKRILEEVDESLKRLQTDWIDLYQIHWPDEKVEIGRTMEALLTLQNAGKIRHIGVCNYSLEQLQESLLYAPVESLQTHYNYLRREAEKDLLPFCETHSLAVLGYGTLGKGVLTGKFSMENRPSDFVRSSDRDADFTPERYAKMLEEVEAVRQKSKEEGKTLSQWIVEWTCRQNVVTSALVGVRNAAQVRENLFTISGNDI